MNFLDKPTLPEKDAKRLSKFLWYGFWIALAVALILVAVDNIIRSM